MLVTPTIVEIATDDPAVQVFKIRGGTRAEDIRAMARHAFDPEQEDEAGAFVGARPH